MPRHTVVTLPGDGIGPLVLEQAIRVLDAVGFEADYVPGDIGWNFWVREGEALPVRTIELLARHRLSLLGAVTSKPKAEAGPGYLSPIVALRQRFALDVCIRPCRSFPGNPLNFVRRTRDGSFEEPTVDVVVFRQNTEGLFAGVEWTDPPPAVREALAGHPRFAPFAATAGRDLAVSTRIVTRGACRRILTAAFDHAREHRYRSVTVVEKPNVLRETSGMMVEEARRVRESYAEIELQATNIDTELLLLTKRPEERGVIVATNLFGDILSDAFAGLVGGAGFAPSANLGAELAVFEPLHGSAPHYAALDPPIVNPLATILAAAMLLDHVREGERAARVRRAVADVVREGRVRTYDMLRLPGGPGVTAQGAATTTAMTDAVLARLG